MHRSFPVDSFTPSLYLESLRHLVFALLLLFGLSFSIFGQQSTVARDDIYFVKGTSRDLFVNENDDNPFGLLGFPTQPAHANIQACNFGCFSPYIVHFNNLDPNRIGFDSFQYKYVVCCGNPPGPDSNTATAYVLTIPGDGATDAGWCPTPPIPSPNVAQPVNVTNGNMWIRHQDYALPGPGDTIEISRFYNSIIQTTGLFGLGWSTKYDESLIFYDPQMIRLNRPDGKAIYFGRKSLTDPYFISFSRDVTGKIAPNPNGTYTLTYQDGSVRNFGSTGRLVSSADRNGNLTTLTYDGNEHLRAVTDAAGRTLTFTPNTDGTISQISDPLGTVAAYEYNADTTLKTVTYPDGSKYKFEDYASIVVNGQTRKLLTTVKDALDNILESHIYDTQGRATTSVKQGGIDSYTLNYTFDGQNYPLTVVTDGKGHVSKYHSREENGINLVFQVEGTCACGSGGSEVTQYFYDYRQNLIEKIDALNHHTTYTYDDDRSIITQTDPLGTQSYTYNSFGEVLTATDRMGGVVTNTYSTAGNLLTTTDALNNTTTLTYNSLGQLETIKDALNHTTTLGYDSQARLYHITDANNKLTSIDYDDRGRPTSVTNALDETTSYLYDPNNRLKKVTFPDTKFVEYVYDLAGRRTSMIDARTNTTIYGYDSAYRLTSIEDALNHTTTFGYDPMSNLESRTDALGNTTDYHYDDFNRLDKITYPPESAGATRLEESFAYNQMGNVKTHVDTAGHVTTYAYTDPIGRLTDITDALGKVTHFDYNARSQMTKVKDALNQEYVFVPDALGHVLSQTRAGSTMSFVYDDVGNRTQRTDYAGRVTTYEYDDLNRLKTVFYGGSPGASYTYDDISRLKSATNEAGTVSFDYDDILRHTTETDVFGHVIETQFDPNWNRSLLRLDNVDYASYVYDNADRLTTITNATDSTNVTYGYDNANHLTSRGYPNGVNTTYDYDGMSRLTRLKDVNASATLFDRQYSYNNANQIWHIVEPGHTRTFGYDDVDRLTSVTDPVNGNESYAYDAVGNRTSSHRSATYGYQTFNRLTSTQTASYVYDSNGNMLTAGSSSFTWDFENRVTEATTALGTWTDYQYDALGRRVSFTPHEMSHMPVTTNFTYEGQNVLMDDVGSGRAETITTYLNGPGIDNKLAQSTDGYSEYFVADHLGSTNAVIDADGSIVTQSDYDAFGNPIGAVNTRYGFTGREDSGLMYYRARWYDPNLGRFISEDPIGFKGGDINLYGYVHSSPLRRTDPFGHEECWFGLGWACEKYVKYHQAEDEMNYDLQLFRNSSRVVSNTNCWRKNANYLFFEIQQLAYYNLSVSATALGGQAAEDFGNAVSPIPRKPDDLFDSSYDGAKGVWENHNSEVRERNLRKIEEDFRAIADANSQNPKQCGCRLPDF